MPGLASYWPNYTHADIYYTVYIHACYDDHVSLSLHSQKQCILNTSLTAQSFVLLYTYCVHNSVLILYTHLYSVSRTCKQAKCNRIIEIN